MSLTSKIEPYDPEWPKRFENAVQKLYPIFRTSLLSIHHVGSTAVIGLAAKPEIDILIVVNSTKYCDYWTPELAHSGFVRGGDLSNGHLFYKRNVKGLRTHKIHVCIDGHKQIRAMLAFRDLLTSNASLREQYQELKLRQEQQNTAGIGEYLESKRPFIDEALKEASIAQHDL